MDYSPAIQIAVADDHPIVVAGITAMFANDESVDVVAAASSLNELTSTLRGTPDIILLDLNIPGEKYRDNIAVIKKRWPRAKIAAYTSYEGVDLVREMMGLGCSGYLLKQDSHEETLAGLRNIMAGRTHVSVVPRKGAGRKSGRVSRGMRDDFQKGLLLSKREKEVLFHIAKGLTSQQMADELFISRYTVETHRKNILRKLDFSSSTELVKFAVEQGLV